MDSANSRVSLPVPFHPVTANYASVVSWWLVAVVDVVAVCGRHCV